MWSMISLPVPLCLPYGPWCGQGDIPPIAEHGMLVYPKRGRCVRPVDSKPAGQHATLTALPPHLLNGAQCPPPPISQQTEIIRANVLKYSPHLPRGLRGRYVIFRGDVQHGTVGELSKTKGLLQTHDCRATHTHSLWPCRLLSWCCCCDRRLSSSFTTFCRGTAARTHARLPCCIR